MKKEYTDGSRPFNLADYMRPTNTDRDRNTNANVNMKTYTNADTDTNTSTDIDIDINTINTIPERFRKKTMTMQEASDYMNYLNSRPRNYQQQQQQVRTITNTRGSGVRVTLADLMNMNARLRRQQYFL